MATKKAQEEKKALEEKKRYEFFQARQGKCQYCGVRLKWDAYEVRGLSGGWVLEQEEDGTSKAYCYKCFEFPQRGKTAHRLTIHEEQRTTAQAMGLEAEAQTDQGEDEAV